MDVNASEVVVAGGELDNLLEDLIIEVGPDATAEDIIEALDEGDTAAVEILVEQTEAMESQVSTIEATVEAVTEQTEKPAKKARTPKTEKAPKEKIERDLSALPAEIFQLGAEAADDANKAVVIGKRPEQKKVAEKFDNLFISLAAGKKPSVYTMACFGVLAEKGEVTTSDLVAALKATASRSGGGYNEGTARSQAGQMMNLFNAVGVAKREGNKLTFNKDSKIAERLKAL